MPKLPRRLFPTCHFLTGARHEGRPSRLGELVQLSAPGLHCPPGQLPQGDRLGNEPTKESLKLHARGTADLTNRQGQVLGYLAMGLTANEIGERLRISTRTARAHMDVLKRKLGANRSPDLPIAYRRATG